MYQAARVRELHGWAVGWDGGWIELSHALKGSGKLGQQAGSVPAWPPGPFQRLRVGRTAQDRHLALDRLMPGAQGAPEATPGSRASSPCAAKPGQLTELAQGSAQSPSQTPTACP